MTLEEQIKEIINSDIEENKKIEIIISLTQKQNYNYYPIYPYTNTNPSNPYKPFEVWYGTGGMSVESRYSNGQLH